MSLSIPNRIFSDALRDMQRAMAVFDQPLWADTTSDTTPSFFSRTGSRYPTTDLIETKDSYELHAEVPGFDKKDIKIEVPNDHTIVLKGTMNKETKKESSAQGGGDETQQQGTSTTTGASDKEVGKLDSQGHRWWVQERVSGSFFRSFQLPITIDSDVIKASCNDGVLKVIIPKTKGKKTMQINID